MKKLLLSLVTVAGLTFAANAQTEKGKFALGGSLYFNTEKEDGNDKADNEIYINPSVAYFIKDNLSVGLSLGFGVEKEFGYEKYTSFNISPFVRKYVNLNDQFKFFGEFAVGFSNGTSKDLSSNGTVGSKRYDRESVNVSLAPGFAFFPSKKFSIELSIDGLSYYSEEYKYSGGSTDKYKGFELDVYTMFPNLGVKFHL